MSTLHLRPRHLILFFALLVGCKRGDGTEPPGDGDTQIHADASDEAGEGGEIDEAAVDEALGPEVDIDPTKPREREIPPAPQTRDAALVAAAHGNPEGAVAFLSKHLADKPDDHEAGLALARAQRLIGQLDASRETLETLRKQVKDAKHEAEILRRLAKLRIARGDAKGAEKLIREARKLAPDNLLLAGELVHLMHLTGRAHESEARQLIDMLYDKYADGTIQSAEELLAAAYAGLAERAFKSSSRVLQEAEQAAPPSSGEEIADEISMELVDLFLEKYKPEEAAETLALVLERDPWQPEALAKMGYVYLDQFGLAAASRAAEESLMVNPENADAHAVLAWVALIEGRREEARERITGHVLNVNPSHHGGQTVMAALAIFNRDKKAFAKARDAVLAFNPNDGLFFAHLGDLLGFLHLYPEADAVLSEGVKLLPDDPYVQAALGLSHLRMGDEAGGREALEKAWKKDKYNARTLNLRQLYRERIEPHYAETRSGDLTLRTPAELQDLLAPNYLAAIDRARKSLDKAYGIKISPLRIEMYAEPEEFSIRTVGVPSLGAVGVCFGPVITSIGPYMGTHNFNQVIWHEIAHSYAIELSAGRVPRWFTEGLSEWESEVADPSWARESSALLFEARRHDKMRKLSELELAFLRAENSLMMEVAYATAAWAMRYLGETYGRPKLIQMLKGYAKGKSTEELMISVLGKDMATIEKEFEAWMDKEIDRKLSGWRPDREAQDDPRLVALMKAFDHANAKELDEAKVIIEKLIAGKGDGYQARMTLAMLLDQQGDQAGARKNYEKAATFNLDSVEPWVAIAQIARKQGDVKVEIDMLAKVLAVDGMSLDPVLRMIILAAAIDDKRLPEAVERGVAIAPLHPVVLSATAMLEHRAKAKKARIKALLDEVMVTALRPDATLDIVVMAALAAAEVKDPRVKDVAARALTAKELPDKARKKLEKHAP